MSYIVATESLAMMGEIGDYGTARLLARSRVLVTKRKMCIFERKDGALWLVETVYVDCSVRTIMPIRLIDHDSDEQRLDKAREALGGQAKSWKDKALVTQGKS